MEVIGVSTPSDGVTAYNTYANYQVYYDEDFNVSTRLVDGYQFIGYIDQYGNIITDSHGNLKVPFNYDYDLVLTEVWEKE